MTIAIGVAIYLYFVGSLYLYAVFKDYVKGANEGELIVAAVLWPLLALPSFILWLKAR